MANKEIPGLTAATLPLTGDELLHGVQSANSRKMTVDDLRGPKLKTLADLTVSQGDLFYVNGSGAIVRLPKGTAGQVLRQNAALTAPEWWTPILGKSYSSGEQALTAGGSLTLAHGFGAKPKIVQTLLVCKVADLGYSIGDEVIINDHMQGNTAANGGHALVLDSTNIFVRFNNTASTYRLNDKSSGSAANGILNTSWRLVVNAWA